MSTKPKIFVSYTLRDNIINKDYLLEVEQVLSKFALPFIDILHNDSDDKQKRIENELIASDILLLLLTNKVFDSPWVIKELTIANNHSIPIHVLTLKGRSEQYTNKLLP